MARFLLATTPVTGHTVPVGVLARALVNRGNHVGWYTGAAFADSVRATGAIHFPVRHENDWSLRHPHDAVPELRTARGLAQVRLAFSRLFIASAPGALADLEAINAEFHADVVVANSLVFADTWLDERGGPVNARVSTTMYASTAATPRPSA